MKTKVILFLLFLLLQVEALFAKRFKFGIMGDTQGSWISGDESYWKAGDSLCPNMVPAGVIDQVHDEMIKHDVKFVLHAGDIGELGEPYSVYTHATYVQKLYNHGIGFFPVRGNHESAATLAAFKKAFPQTQNGINNATPEDVFVKKTTFSDGYSWPEVGMSLNPTPAAPQGEPFQVGTDWMPHSGAGNGLVYAFTYENARFVLFENFFYSNIRMGPLLPWIDEALSKKPEGGHAFTLSHLSLWGERRGWGLFGGTPAEDPASQNQFVSILSKHGVAFHIYGHEHFHYRSAIDNTDGSKFIFTLQTQSLSWKFNVATVPAIATQYNIPAYGKDRWMPIAWHRPAMGFYIVTVDGPQVVFDYYAVPVVLDQTSDEKKYITGTPDFSKVEKYESWGYVRGGAQGWCKPGDTYTNMTKSLQGTTFKILSGSNTHTKKAHDGSKLTQMAFLGLRDTTLRAEGDTAMASNIGVIGGMVQDMIAPTLGISMTYPFGLDVVDSTSGILIETDSGKWVHAVDLNTGGEKKFVKGPWNSSYELGTYGIDEATSTAWAVVNVNGNFAVGTFKEEIKDTVVAAEGQKAMPPQVQRVVAQGNDLIFPVQGKDVPVRAEIFNLEGRLINVVNGHGPVIRLQEKLSGMYVVRWHSGGVGGIQKVLIKK
ncbi:MAG: metallophosphoesterase [Fibrobacteria bacterium]|nr:metallophosphoesterase [Fibrobacteria bacterium]